MINKLPIYFKINVIAILLCAISILGLSVGYSILSSQFNLNTNVLLSANNSISITNIGNMTSVSNAYEVNNLSHTSNTITSNVGLPNLDSSVSYLITLSNNTDIVKEISDITYTSNNDSIVYSISGISKNQSIEAGKQVTFTLTYSYDASVTSLPDVIEDTSLLEFTFIDYVKPELTYVQNNLLLNLSGEDAPVDNSWINKVDGNKMALTNVTYDAETKSYNFTSGGYGKYPSAVIPSTGDFTIETVITVPAKLSTSDDQAILSQMNDTKTTTGRFKIDYKYSSPNYSLLIFANETSINNNTFNYFSNSVIASTTYVLEAVRTGDKLLLYLDGSLVTSANFPTSNVIAAEPLKLARWQTSTPQSFKGYISAVRIYNSALSADEINNNYTIDYKKYLANTIDDSTHVIKDYALSKYLVSTGDGLYKEDNNTYRFRGSTVNNYVKFKDSPDLYRIISIDSDDNMKLINISQNLNIPFDQSGNRTYKGTAGSSFCDSAEVVAESGSTTQMYKGCSAFSSNGTTVMNDSSIKTYLNDTFYNALSSGTQVLLKEQSLACGRVATASSTDDLLTQINSTLCTTKIGLLTLEDVVKSPTTNIESLTESTKGSSYLLSIPTTTMAIWTMNGTTDNTFDVWCFTGSTGLIKRRGSRYNQTNVNPNLYFYAYPVIKVSSLIEVTGNGSDIMPFLIEN